MNATLFLFASCPETALEAFFTVFGQCGYGINNCHTVSTGLARFGRVAEEQRAIGWCLWSLWNGLFEFRRPWLAYAPPPAKPDCLDRRRASRNSPTAAVKRRSLSIRSAIAPLLSPSQQRSLTRLEPFLLFSLFKARFQWPWLAYGSPAILVQPEFGGPMSRERNAFCLRWSDCFDSCGRIRSRPWVGLYYYY